MDGRLARRSEEQASLAGAQAAPARDGARPAKSPPPAGKKLSRPKPTAARSANSAARHGSIEQPSLVTSQWRFTGMAIAAMAVFSGVSLGELPPPGLAAMLALSTLIPFAAPKVQQFERANSHRALARFGAMIALILLPMLLFGAAIASWTVGMPGDHWYESIGTLVILSAFAAIVLNGRLPAIMAAKVGLWLGAALIVGSVEIFAALSVGICVGIGAAIYQLRADRAGLLAEQKRRRDQRRAEDILADYEQTGQGWFWETDRQGAITYVSGIVGEVLSRPAERLVGAHFTSLFDLDASGGEGERTLTFHLSARSSFQDLAVRAETEDDERWWSISGRPVYDSFNNFVGFRGSGTDLTERRRSEEHASRLAHYDSLTGLANRFQMSQTLEKILTSQRIEQRACTIFLLDLDRFKHVNDTLGHPAGDALLKQVAERLEWTVDKYGRVGRLGGDEFEVIIPGVHRREDLADLAQRVIANLSQPYAIDGHRVVIGASIGVAISPDDGVTAEALIRNADLALYAAKDSGRGRHHFYASDLHSDAEERRRLEQDLRDALSNGGLELHYQPVVHTATERITGFEALLRWDHPVHGPISPAKFIPIAEDAGLIAGIGEWALRQACIDLSKWPESVRVAVNVSTLQFANPALPAIVTNALAAAQVDPSRLELEITESVFLNDDDGTDAMFVALKRVGVRLALDDFGTGYSSLGYLKKAPFDKIKIDQSFVRGATQPGSRNGALIASIVSLAESLGMETTAEGVETLDELDLVRMLGCSHVQGYIYAKPLRAEVARTKLAEGLTAIAHGPRSARAPRHTMLRKVVLEHGDQRYHGTIRNISGGGALIEGLWNVPPGTIFRVQFGDGQIETATTRWSRDDRMGVEFATSLAVDATGQVVLNSRASDATSGPLGIMRRAGG